MARQLPRQRQPRNVAGGGQIATVPVTPKFQPLKPRPHLRQDEIDAQPVPVSMGGIGNGIEGRNGYGRGQ